MARIDRGHIPEVVAWNQAAILSAIARISSGLSQLSQLTGNPTSDSSGTVVRNVRDYEIIEAIKANTIMLERISEQLEILS